MNENQSILNAKFELKEKINFIKNLVNEPVNYNGRFLYHLIDKNPIQAALDTIEMYQEFDLRPLEIELKNAEEELAIFLNSNKKDPEVEEAIQEIFKSNNKAFKRMQDRLANINSEKTKSISPLTALPKDILFIIFTNSGVTAFGQLMQVCKLFHKQQFNQECWKYFTLEENPNFFKRYSNLKNKQINWKKVCQDLGFNLERWKGDDKCSVFMLSIKEKSNKLVSYDFLPILNINLDSNINIKTLKQIIVKNSKYSFKPSDFHLFLEEGVMKRDVKLEKDEFSSFKIPFQICVPHDNINLKKIQQLHVSLDVMRDRPFIRDYIIDEVRFISLRGLIEHKDDKPENPENYNFEDWMLENEDKRVEENDKLIEDENKCKCNSIMF